MTTPAVNIPADRCPLCCGDTRVTETRPTDASLRRRRVCMVCAHRFTTYEVISADDAPTGALVMFSKRRLTQIRHAISSIDRLIGGASANKRGRGRKLEPDADLDQPVATEMEASP